MGVTAVGAFSGGLDSVLAAWLLSRQGIGLELVTFESPFFPVSEAESMAAQIGELNDMRFAEIPETGTALDASRFEKMRFCEGETLHYSASKQPEKAAQGE